MGSHTRGYDILHTHVHRLALHHGADSVRGLCVPPAVDQSVRPEGEENQLDGLSTGGLNCFACFQFMLCVSLLYIVRFLCERTVCYTDGDEGFLWVSWE